MSDQKPGFAQWAVQTAIAGVAMSVAFAGYINTFVYPRKEGEKLEQLLKDAEARMQLQQTQTSGRLQRMEDEYRADLRQIRDRMDAVLAALTRLEYAAGAGPKRKGL